MLMMMMTLILDIKMQIYGLIPTTSLTIEPHALPQLMA